MSDRPKITRRQASKLILGAAGALLTRDTLAQSEQVLADRRFAPLQKEIAGRVVKKGDPLYQDVRGAMVWNKRVSKVRSPDAIVQVASAQDVATAVRFARKSGLKVAVRGGGHNYHGAVLRNGGILLDLGRLNATDIDGQERRASVGPAVKGGELIAALAPHGLAFPVGHCSDVRLSGYLLNGGLGWNFGAWGPACMSVRGMEMVTASGDILYADAGHHADLFWAARGAGPGFFAVVTRYDLALYTMPQAIRSYSVNFEFESMPIVASWVDEAIRSVHPTVEVDCTLGPIDASEKLAIGISAAAFASSQEEAVGRLGALRNLPSGAKLIGPSTDQPASFRELQQLTDTGFPGGKRMFGDVHFSDATVGKLLREVQHLAANAPSPPSVIVAASMGGGAKLSTDGKGGAYSVDGARFFGAYAFWDDPAQDRIARAWVRSVMRAAEPLSTGSYVGEADLSRSPNLARNCFSAEAWARLVSLKQKYDPDNLFYSYLTER
ncbi:MAG TPA: FAD-binding oxidoreductase [Candidatus Polarisedimenticolia bacterium]|nr:FAD-binding oxidoreductase [Candidatus Polarisedimenticolia bacterium]